MITADLHIIQDYQKYLKHFSISNIKKVRLFLENGGFKNSTPPQTAINGGKLNICEENSEISFQKCLCCNSNPKVKVDMILSKHLTWNYICNGFLTVSPPKTAINGGKLNIIE